MSAADDALRAWVRESVLRMREELDRQIYGTVRGIGPGRDITRYGGSARVVVGKAYGIPVVADPDVPPTEFRLVSSRFTIRAPISNG